MSAELTGHGAKRLARTDWLFALGIGALLQVAWAAQDWTNLRVLRLPDTDDMMRLQQIRDWLNGQSWWDLTQHRLGLGDGLAMHWTRVNDLIPALIITLVRPLAGVHNAELAAVLLAPALMFFAFLMLSARAALSLAGPASNKTDVTKIAIIVAAFAFPATGMFIPGRIDHHALQIVLLLAAVVAGLSAPSWRSGALAGAAWVISFIVGLETLPQMVAVAGGMVICWALYAPKSRSQLVAFGASLFLGTTLLFIPFGITFTAGAFAASCDRFNGTTLMLPSSIGFGLLLVGWHIRRDRWLFRLMFGIGILLLTIAGFVYAAPACRAGPYGMVDPFLLRVWMAHVGEAQGLFQQSTLGIVWGYSVLVLVALLVTGGTIIFGQAQKSSAQSATERVRSPAHGGAISNADQSTIHYLIIAAPLGMSALVMLFQLRGAYIGAGLAAPILAVWITQMRARGSLALVAAWLLSAGVVHHLLADALDARLLHAQPAAAATPPQASMGKSSGGAGCADAATMAALNRLPPSRIMGPVDFGAYAIGMTPHHVFAAPYHRNNSGNLAMYRFFMASPDAAAVQAHALKLDYVLICPDSLSELNAEPGLANSLVVALKSGQAPKWLSRSALWGSSAMLFKVGVK